MKSLTKAVSIGRCVLLHLMPIFSESAIAEPFAYAANEKSGTISIIDTATNAVVGDIAAGKKPRGMAASKDGKDTVRQRSARKGIAGHRHRVAQDHWQDYLGESPEGVYRSPDGKWVVVAVEEDNSVHFVDMASGRMSSRQDRRQESGALGLQSRQQAGLREC